MARKQIEVAINDPASRDHGRRYVLTEMPASQAEKFAARCFLAMARGGGVEVPENVKAAGMAGLAIMGFQMLGKLDFAEASALMDEMMGCVQYAYEPNNAAALRPLAEVDVEEVATRMRLRSELFTLHTGFSLADVPSKLTQAPAGS